jgi:urease accessory protein
MAQLQGINLTGAGIFTGIVCAGVGFASPAWAHIDQATLTRFGPFIAGILHPVLGPDHLLAMVSVGFLSAVLGARHFWLVPVCFVGTMPIGWVLGRLGVAFPPVEIGIALSVILLGLGCLLAKRLPIWSVYSGVITFALLHGYAHGRETPAVDMVQYASGFMMGTAGLHIVGLFLGDILYQPDGRNYFRAAISTAVVGAGLYFLVTSLTNFQSA